LHQNIEYCASCDKHLKGIFDPSNFEYSECSITELVWFLIDSKLSLSQMVCFQDMSQNWVSEVDKQKGCQTIQ
jgi:hypothetical protein